MVALITPTGGRLKQISLCAEFMRNQDYTGEVVWIIVDDCEPRTTDIISADFRDRWTICKIYPDEKWVEGKNTQARNLLVGVEQVRKYYSNVEAIFIIEDDDYYSPRYLRIMVEKLKGYDLAGQTCTVYYHVASRRWMRNGNYNHASLFQTAFTVNAIHAFENVCSRRITFIDNSFFRYYTGPLRRRVNLFDGKDLAIGIKGLPGRQGIGMGHRAEIRMAPDPKLVKLKELIGDDYIYYL